MFARTVRMAAEREVDKRLIGPGVVRSTTFATASDVGRRSFQADFSPLREIFALGEQVAAVWSGLLDAHSLHRRFSQPGCRPILNSDVGGRRHGVDPHVWMVQPLGADPLRDR